MREGKILLPGGDVPISARVDAGDDPKVHIGERTLGPGQFSWATPAGGLVYGVILNDRCSLERLGAALNEPPYKAPPRAPILYVKPYNTHRAHGARVTLPAGADRVEVAATLGLIFGRDASRVPAERALDYLRGYTVVADLSLPHASYFRPAIREKCFDGACPMGPWLVDCDQLPDPQSALIRTYADGKLLEERTLADAIRPIRQLIAEVTEFMSLKAGDVLLCGVRYGAPVVAAGAAVAIEIEGIGRLSFDIDQAEAER